MYMCVYIYIYIYIWRERDRNREREISLDKGNKRKNKQIRYIKLKSFCIERKSSTKQKENLLSERIFDNVTFDKVLISKIYKEFRQLNTK